MFDLDCQIITEERKEFWNEIKNTLTFREYDILCAKLGINEYSKSQTYKKCGEKFNVSSQQARMVLFKAIRKLEWLFNKTNC